MVRILKRMNTWRGWFLTGLLAACLAESNKAAATNSGEDWPQFLGPRANGTSLESGLLESWPTNFVSTRLLWAKEIGTGYSAPSVRGEQIVLHHRLGDEEVVESFQAATGKPVWRHAYPSHFIDPYGYNNGPRSTPLLTSNRCYTFGAEGKLACLDLSSGKLVWQRDTAADFEI